MVKYMLTDQLTAPEALKVAHKELGGVPGKGDSRRNAYHLAATAEFATYKEKILTRVKLLWPAVAADTDEW